MDFAQTVLNVTDVVTTVTNVVAEIQLKLLNERALSTGEPCSCEYVTLLQSFHRGTLSINWYIAQKF